MNYWKRRAASFKYAGQGIKELFCTQPNFKTHLFAAAICFMLGYMLKIERIEWCVILICIGNILALEALNTSIEYLADIVSPDYHPLIGKAKDMAAAAVLIMSIAALIAGGLIFLPKLMVLLF